MGNHSGCRLLQDTPKRCGIESTGGEVCSSGIPRDLVHTLEEDWVAVKELKLDHHNGYTS